MSNRSNLTLPYQSIERSFKIQPEFFEMEFKSKQSSMTIWKMNQLALIKWKFSNCNFGFCFVICVSRARWINWVPLKFIVQLKSIKIWKWKPLCFRGSTNESSSNKYSEMFCEWRRKFNFLMCILATTTNYSSFFDWMMW